MNILLKTTALLLFALGLNSPLLAQKKLALANECFNAKAYYLACRYYQEASDNIDPCHPDQLKFAQSLTVTQQLSKADQVYLGYLNCQKNDPTAGIAYGKFLMDIQAYEKAIPYFQRSLEAKPEEASHYLLVCQKELSRSEEKISPVFVHQEAKTKKSDIEKIAPEPITLDSKREDPSQLVEKKFNEIDSEPDFSPAAPNTQIVEKTISTPIVYSENKKIISTERKKIEKKNSPFGVRLGTYRPTKIPSLTSVANFGTLEEKSWDGKVIFYLVGFSSREEAEVALNLARAENFRSAILVEKQASGRMKSIR